MKIELGWGGYLPNNPKFQLLLKRPPSVFEEDAERGRNGEEKNPSLIQFNPVTEE